MKNCLIMLSLILFALPAWGGELNIYSYREPQLIEPLLKAYTAETATRFNVVYAPKGLAQRLALEGESSPADLVLTVDISRLAELKDLDLLAPLDSDLVNERIPPHLRDSVWVALTMRARVVVASSERVADGAISRIEDLADPKWKGKVCTRKGSHVYNRALLASMVAHHGEAEAEAWAKGVVANLARKPQGNDRAQAKAIFAGECDIALMNTYYFGKMKFNEQNPEQKAWAEAIKLVFLNQADRGQHVNISGVGIAKNSRRKGEARAFIEWLTDEEAQRIYASVNYEYPVNSAVKADSEVASWGVMRVDSLPIDDLARYSATAQKIIDRVGW